ncbi:MAG: hypothetical protein J6O13_15645 [Selenomonas sp.]|nr:hypothetical protein [Selenomonas sp.]
MDLSWLKQKQSADEYLQHAYKIPTELSALPLADESFVASWQEAKGREVLDFLADELKLAAYDFVWQETVRLSLSFAHTMGGTLPVIATGCHKDFRAMEAVLNGRTQSRDLPLTVNAFTLETQAEPIYRQRVLLLNRAPYSNIPAEDLNLSAEDWLERSRCLRLRHECSHYETLRLLGGMRNHALDEILADALGQLAAFGRFDADRQRLFFGLEKGQDSCNGRLSFYCQQVSLEERPKIYCAVDKILDSVACEINVLLRQMATQQEIFLALAGRSIADRLDVN